MNQIKLAVGVDGFAELSIEYLLELFHIRGNICIAETFFKNKMVDRLDTTLLREINKILNTEGLVGKLKDNFIVEITKL